MAVNFNKIPFIQAKNFLAVDPAKKEKDARDPRVIVIHSMEAPEKPQTAENIAHWFANQKPNEGPSSVHYCGDNNSIVQCVQTKDVAYGAKGFNRHGIHLELAGYARQSRIEWMDEYSLAMLELYAELCGRILMPKYDIEPKWLSEYELRSASSNKDMRGFTTHAMISKAFGIKGGHTDPGPGFPFNEFMEMVRKHYYAQ